MINKKDNRKTNVITKNVKKKKKKTENRKKKKKKKSIPCNVHVWVYNIRPLLPVLKNYRIIIVHVIETICDLKVR